MPSIATVTPVQSFDPKGTGLPTVYITGTDVTEEQEVAIRAEAAAYGVAIRSVGAGAPGVPNEQGFATVQYVNDEIAALGVVINDDFKSTIRGYDSRYDPTMMAMASDNRVTAPDIGPYLTEIANAGFDKIVLAGGQFSIRTMVDLPTSVRWLDLQGCILNPGNDESNPGAGSDGATPMFQRSGSIAWAEDVPTIPIGSRSFVTADISKYSIGDYVLLGGENYPLGAPTGNRYGWMRQIRSITPSGSGSAGTIGFHIPTPRVLDANPHVFKFALAPSFRISGDAASAILGVGYRAPYVDYEQYLIKLYHSDRFVLDGDLTIGDHSRSAIMLTHVNGGHAGHGVKIRNIWDQSSGYGINLCGSTRHFNSYATVERARHAMTTNVGSNLTLPGPGGVVTAYGAVGEPEDNLWNMKTSYCTNKANDTHRLGINNRIIVDDNGSFGAVQVRADATSAEGQAVNQLASAITVASTVAIAPKITDFLVDGVSGGDGITALSPLEGSNITIRRIRDNAFGALATGYGGTNTGTGVTIDGLTVTDTKYGIKDYAGDMVIDNYSHTNVEVPYSDGSGRPVGAISKVRRKDGFTNLASGGRWFSCPASAWSTGSLPAGSAYGERIALPAGTITDMQFTVITGGAGANARLSLYTVTPAGAIRLVAEATRDAGGTLVPVDCSTSGVKTVSFPTPIVQRGGVFVMSIRTQGAAATYQRATLLDLVPSDTAAAPVLSRVAFVTTGLTDGSAFPDDYYAGTTPSAVPIALGVKITVA